MAGVEKKIEKSIIKFLESKGAWAEQLQSGQVLVKKGPYSNMMKLCSNGTPDIICVYKGLFIAIEVKKDQKETDSWIKKEIRYKESGELPKSYEREKNQIKHKHKIMENGGVHIIAHDLNEVKEFINNLK